MSRPGYWTADERVVDGESRASQIVSSSYPEKIGTWHITTGGRGVGYWPASTTHTEIVELLRILEVARLAGVAQGVSQAKRELREFLEIR